MTKDNSEIETAKKAEKIAKRRSIQCTGSDGLWEMFLTEAYDQLFDLPNHLHGDSE